MGGVVRKGLCTYFSLRRIDRGRFFEDFFGGGGLGQEQCVVLFNEGP